MIFRSLLLLILTTLYGLPLSAAIDESTAKSPAQVQAELNALEAEIDKFQKQLKATQGERSKLEKDLESNEKNINELLNHIKEMQQGIKDGEDKLSALSIQEQSLQASKLGQQESINKQIRAAFELGKQQYLKVVLNQEDPNRLSRMLNYYDYFNRARLAEIAEYEATLQGLDIVASSISEQNELLKTNRIELQQRKAGLVSVQSQHKQVLAALIREMAETGTQLDRRLADRQRLEQLMNTIVAGIANITEPKDAKPFASMKGHLFYPVAGHIDNEFGHKRGDGKLRWNGIFIAAPEGEPVHAVHYGRVVFSDWLRGFGLLIIINHGDGYMSLYGHNQVLYRQTGDWVSSGDTIANVGNTGGQQEYGLYFEIRSAGKPTNPQLWCQARPEQKAA